MRHRLSSLLVSLWTESSIGCRRSYYHIASEHVRRTEIRAVPVVAPIIISGLCTEQHWMQWADLSSKFVSDRFPKLCRRAMRVHGDFGAC